MNPRYVVKLLDAPLWEASFVPRLCCTINRDAVLKYPCT